MSVSHPECVLMVYVLTRMDLINVHVMRATDLRRMEIVLVIQQNLITHSQWEAYMDLAI